jgi:AcrR family transcriptional regulator
MKDYNLTLGDNWHILTLNKHKYMRKNDRTKPNPTTPLRERKKSKVRAQLKQHALHLFIEQGYASTTIEQIAEKAEVSPRTFFRYFASKEDLVFDDDYDAQLIASFRTQSLELSVVGALRGALRAAFTQLPDEKRIYEHQRHAIISTTPELQVRNGHEFIRNIELLADLIAERTHQQTGDQAVRTLAGALVGVLISARIEADKDPKTNPLELTDASLEQFEAMMSTNK